MTTAGGAARAMGGAEWVMLVALAVLWGGSFFFNAVALSGLPVFSVVAARVALGAAVLFAILRATGRRLPGGAPVWAAFLGMGVLNNALPFTLFVWGQQELASGVAAILNAATPLFTALLAHWLTTDERLTPARAAGVAMGLLGVAGMMGQVAVVGLGGAAAAQLACLGGALSYAFAGIFGRRFRALGVAPMAAAAGQLAASSMLLVPLALLADRPWQLPMPGVETFAALAGLGVLCTALAYALYFRILATAGATNLLLVTLLIPVSAVLLGVWVLHETLEARHLVGMALIGLGLAVMDGRPFSALRHGLRRLR